MKTLCNAHVDIRSAKRNQFISQKLGAMVIYSKSFILVFSDIVSVPVHVAYLVKRSYVTVKRPFYEVVICFLVILFHIPAVVIAVTEIFSSLTAAMLFRKGIVFDSLFVVLLPCSSCRKPLTTRTYFVCLFSLCLLYRMLQSKKLNSSLYLSLKIRNTASNTAWFSTAT